MKLDYACFTDVGKKRKVNEDSFLALPGYGLFGVADGVGGLGAGDIASRIAVDVIADRLVVTEEEEQPLALEELIQQANQEIQLQKNNIAMEMATTIVLARFMSESIRIAHVGDSRAYLFRDRQLRQLTDDHSLVAELYRHGKIGREEMDSHPQRNIITQAVGLEIEVEPGCTELTPCPDDLLLLCSDGLHSMLTDESIRAILAEPGRDIAELGYELVNMANFMGGRDNITVILLRYSLEDFQEE